MSNTKYGLLVGGAAALAVLTGAGGFYAGQLTGQLHAKVEFLEAQRIVEAQRAAAPAPAPAPYAAAPTLPAPAPIPAQPPASPLNADGVPVQLAPVLQDAESVAPLLAALSQATAFEVEGEIAQDQPIFAFFDPRCPYCKRAMQELNGKANINWIPVSLLGDLQSGSNMIEGMRTLEGQAAIQAAADGAIPAATGTTETQGQLQDNAAILFALYEGANDVVAVPSFVIPRSDGTATFYRGFNNDDAATILEAYGS